MFVLLKKEIFLFELILKLYRISMYKVRKENRFECFSYFEWEIWCNTATAFGFYFSLLSASFYIPGLEIKFLLHSTRFLIFQNPCLFIPIKYYPKSMSKCITRLPILFSQRHILKE
jgi:hypothetical protein